MFQLSMYSQVMDLPLARQVSFSISLTGLYYLHNLFPPSHLINLEKEEKTSTSSESIWYLGAKQLLFAYKVVASLTNTH